MSDDGFGFNVMGHVSGNLGLGVSVRTVIQALLDNGYPVSAFDIEAGLGRDKHDLRFESRTVAAPEQLPYAVNLVVLPPPTLAQFVPRYASYLADAARFNVAFVLWELPVIPRHWRAALEFFDALVAPSGFIRHTLDVELSSTMTIGSRTPLYFPPDVSSDKKRFGIRDGETTYVTSFEPASDVTRKNALAVVEAFALGLSDFEQARLIIRMNNASGLPRGNRAVDSLFKAGERDPRIRFITEPLRYSDVLSLYASCDVFVSLHRSEGIGLGPMEAMALGKPCIATAWSGNMEFMDHTNAALVSYKLVPVAGAGGAYSNATLRGLPAVWAEPDIHEAAAWMRRLQTDPAFRIALGTRASAAITQFQDDAMKVHFAGEIRALWEHRASTRSAADRIERLESAVAAAAAASPRGVEAIAKARRAASQALDRHVLWRFRH